MRKRDKIIWLTLDALLLLFLWALITLGQEQPITLASQWPEFTKHCDIKARDWNGHRDYVARCILKVYRNVPETKVENGVVNTTMREEYGPTLFDFPLTQAHPATFAEASKSVGRWLEEASNEILRRNGYISEKEKKHGKGKS